MLAFLKHPCIVQGFPLQWLLMLKSSEQRLLRQRLLQPLHLLICLLEQVQTFDSGLELVLAGVQPLPIGFSTQFRI